MAYSIISNIGVVTTTQTMTNPCALQTTNNVVMICGDVTLTNYTANDIVLTLPEDTMFPLETLTIPVCITTQSQTDIIPMHITNNGNIILETSYASATLHLNGICWNANSRYYTPTIGNIYNDGTSPLGAL